MAIDTAAHYADFSKTAGRAATSSSCRSGRVAHALPQVRQPRAQGPDVQEPLGGLGHLVRQHGHRRVQGGDAGQPRVVPQEHERRRASRSGATTSCGPPTSATARVPGALGRQRLGQAQERTTGTASSSTTRTRRCNYHYHVDRGGQVPVRRRLQRRDRLGPRLDRPASAGRGQARRSRTSANGAGYRAVVSGWLKYVSGGMEEQFTKYGTIAGSGLLHRAATGTASSRCSSETQAMGKIFLGISHSARGDQAAARYGWATMLLGGRRATRRSRCTPTTPTRRGSPSTTTTSARRRAPRPSWPAACTVAPSPAAWCSSTRPTRASP